jgi:rSAM/selenodomain-associated transferase 1
LAGEVKTRLGRSIGPTAAADLQRAFLETLVQRFATLADERWLCYWPPESAAAFAALAAGRWRLAPQAHGDLGARMAAFAAGAFEASCSGVLLVGADAPDLPRALVEQAVAALDRADVVLGPADDGGYYLLGLARRGAPIFADMPWSTPSVCRETRRRLEQAGWTLALLPGWSDVDRLEDLHALADRLALVVGDPALARLRAPVARALGAARAVRAVRAHEP